MKATSKYFVLTALAFVCALGVSAQNLPEGTYEGKNGIAYRKSSTLKPGTNDTYVVNLETFVYGAVTIKNMSIPADIVLVLDVSGSMNETMYEHVYTARSSQSYSYESYGDNTYYYKHTDGKYYPVRRGVYRTGIIFFGEYHSYLYYVVNGTYYYLHGNSVVLTRPETPSTGWREWFGTLLVARNRNATIWTGVLYNVQEIDHGTKLANLKTAVNSFIDAIQHNDLYDDDGERRKDENNQETSLGNQISIVKFAMDEYYNSSAGYNSDSAPTAVGNHFSGSYNYTEVVAGFTTTATEANVTSLKNTVTALRAGGATAADYGLNLAHRLFSTIQDSRPNSTKTVVFFTDGSPTYGNSFDETVAKNAINNAYKIKTTYGATVYTVGVFGDLVAVDDEGVTDETEAQNVDTYMSRVSSNYPDARDFTSPSTPLPEARQKYYQNVITGTDLADVFQSIAQASGGSGATEVSSESTVTIDVVASSFSLPYGVTADDITVTVAPCTGETRAKEDLGGGKERLYYTFGQDKASTAYGLPAIVPTVDASRNMVTTSGFDFSANWCGYDASVPQWRGYKQTISFEIKLNGDSVGGPNVATNARESGIYVNGHPVAEFNRPVVKIPVSLWIKKIGLIGDDSAVFNVQYAHYEEGVDPTSLPSSAWKSFTKVILNSKSPQDTDGNPMVKLVGLDPDYFYRIKEDAWAWTYTYVADGIQYVFGENQQNPFVFTNIPQPNIKSGEATVQNVFNPASSSD